MWRRVPCEQPLHTGQSILSPRRNPMSMGSGMSFGESREHPVRRAKGNPVPIPEPGCGTALTILVLTR